ncbi:MAG: hypothetical protein HQL82_12905 [Magnetococcales bacterium]|nr:hypothetical protein [Magnetococcales bacterium]
MLFDQARDLFLDCLAQVDPAQLDDIGQAWFSRTIDLMEQVARFSSGANQVQWKVSRQDQSQLGLDVRATPVPKILQFQMRMGAGRGQGEEESVTLGVPGPDAYAEYIGIMVDTLLRLKRLDHLLILVDDADLLVVDAGDREYGEGERTGQRSQLADALLALYRCRGIDVLLTARSLYARSKKEFHTLVDLSWHSPMPEETLAEIYGVHMVTFGPRDGDPGDFLPSPVVAEAARLANHLPGLFLQHLRIAYERSVRELPFPRDIDWYLEVFRQRLREMLRISPDGTNVLLEAIRNNRMEISVPGSDPFYGSDLDNEFVIQSYYAHGLYEIVPLVSRIWQGVTGHEPA